MNSVTPDLRPFFSPSSVAVVGAGERATSSGGAVFQNLRLSGYQGQMIPVNPKGGTVFGIPAVTSLTELSEPADLVVIVIRPDLIPGAMREAGETGHKSVLILPGGFAEAGADGAARDHETQRIADQYGITIAGPNCAGLISLTPDFRFAATFLRDMPPGPGQRGTVALISQSGAIAEEAIDAANKQAIPLGAVVSVGNGMHLGIVEYLQHLGADESVSAIMLYIESIPDAPGFIRLCREVAARKPVVALYGGRTTPGAAAAEAHTGATPSDDQTIETFLADAGAVRVRSLRQLMLAAKGFGTFPQGLGNRVLIMSNSGGPGVIASDQAVDAGLQLPPLPDAMAEALRAALPPEASVANPVDLLADAREDRFSMAVTEMAEHAGGTFDAVLGIHVVPFMVDAAPVVAEIARLAGTVPVPFMHSMMGTLPGQDDWFRQLEDAGVPAFADSEQMAECAGLLAQYRQIVNGL